MKVPKTSEGICGLHALNFDYLFRHDSVRTPLVDEGFQKLRRTPRRSASSPCVRSAPTITLKLSRDDCCVKSTGSTARSTARSGIPGRTAPARQARVGASSSFLLSPALRSIVQRGEVTHRQSTGDDYAPLSEQT